MKIPHIIKTAQTIVQTNSPAILTGVGIVGTVGTAYLTGKAAYEASKIITEYEIAIEEGRRANLLDDLSVKEKVGLTWKLYVPAAGAGALTIGSIYFANRINSRRLAALAAAYTIAEKANSEYKEKVLEMFGKNKEEAVRAGVQQDRIDRDGDVDGMIDTELEDGRVRCKDAWSGRYFRSTMEEMKAAQNNLNHVVLNNQNASLSEFYNWLDLEPTKESDDIGWTSDKLLELKFTSNVDSKGRPVLVMDFAVAPIRDYWKRS